MKRCWLTCEQMVAREKIWAALPGEVDRLVARQESDDVDTA